MSKLLKFLGFCVVFCGLFLYGIVDAKAANGDLTISTSCSIPSGSIVESGSVITISVLLVNNTESAINNIKVSVSGDSYWGQTVNVPANDSKTIVYRYSLKSTDVGDSVLEFNFLASNNFISAKESYEGSSSLQFIVSKVVSLEFNVKLSSSNSFPLKIGSSIKYDVELKNTGNSVIRDLVISSELDEGLNIDVQAIQPGQLLQDLIVYTVPTDFEEGELSHKFNLNFSNQETQSVLVKSSVVGISGVTVSYSVSNANPESGERVIATVVVSNNGSVPLYNVVIHTKLDPDWDFTIPLLASNSAVSEKFTYIVPYEIGESSYLDFDFSIVDSEGKPIAGTEYKEPPNVIVNSGRNSVIEESGDSDGGFDNGLDEGNNNGREVGYESNLVEDEGNLGEGSEGGYPPIAPVYVEDGSSTLPILSSIDERVQSSRGDVASGGEVLTNSVSESLGGSVVGGILPRTYDVNMENDQINIILGYLLALEIIMFLIILLLKGSFHKGKTFKDK